VQWPQEARAADGRAVLAASLVWTLAPSLSHQEQGKLSYATARWTHLRHRQHLAEPERISRLPAGQQGLAAQIPAELPVEPPRQRRGPSTRQPQLESLRPSRWLTAETDDPERPQHEHQSLAAYTHQGCHPKHTYPSSNAAAAEHTSTIISISPPTRKHAI